MLRTLGCGGLSLAVLAGLIWVSTTQVGQVFGLYALLIGSAATDDLTSIAVRAHVLEVSRSVETGALANEAATITYQLPGEAAQRQAKLARQVQSYQSGWYVGQQLPILVSRLDHKRVRLDGSWHLRPEGKHQIATIAKMVEENTRRSRAARAQNAENVSPDAEN